MVNHGVTCYLNAAMQALAACPALVGHMRTSAPVLALPHQQKSELADAFAHVLEQLCHEDGQSAPPVQPSDLISAARGLTHALSGQGQQDAQEFLCALLDKLHEFHKRPLSEPEIVDLRARLSARWRECTGEEWKDEAQIAYEAQLKAREKKQKLGEIAPAIPPPPRPSTSLFAQLFEGGPRPRHGRSPVPLRHARRPSPPSAAASRPLSPLRLASTFGRRPRPRRRRGARAESGELCLYTRSPPPHGRGVTRRCRAGRRPAVGGGSRPRLVSRRCRRRRPGPR